MYLILMITATHILEKPLNIMLIFNTISHTRKYIMSTTHALKNIKILICRMREAHRVYSEVILLQK